MWLLIKDVERGKSSLSENNGNMELEIFIKLEIKISMEIIAKLFLFPLAGLVLTTGVHVVGRKGNYSQVSGPGQSKRYLSTSPVVLQRAVIK